MLAEVLDFLILAWLIATWFYEGHHRRCKVESVCPKCQEESTVKCKAGE